MTPWIVTALTPDPRTAALMAVVGGPRPAPARTPRPTPTPDVSAVAVAPYSRLCSCCTRKHYGHGFCRPHWREYVVGRKPLVKQGACTVDGCTSEAHARGYCVLHWYRWRRNGDPLVARPGGRKPSGTPSSRAAYQRAYRARRYALRDAMKAKWRQLGRDAVDGLR